MTLKEREREREREYGNIISLFARSSHQRSLMVFHWSLSDSKSPGLFSVFWPISIMMWCWWSQFILRFPTVPVAFPRLWGTIPNAPVTGDITVTLIFHDFLISLTRAKYLSIRFALFYFHSVVPRNGKVPKTASSFFLFIKPRSGFPVGIRWPVCIS